MSTFADVIGNLEGGRIMADLNRLVSEVTLAALEHRKVGEISIALKVSPNGDGVVTVAAAVKSKIPEANRGVTIFFADGAGNLLRRDPRQSELPLREVADNRPADFRTA